MSTRMPGEAYLECDSFVISCRKRAIAVKITNIQNEYKATFMANSPNSQLIQKNHWGPRNVQRN